MIFDFAPLFLCVSSFALLIHSLKNSLSFVISLCSSLKHPSSIRWRNYWKKSRILHYYTRGLLTSPYVSTKIYLNLF